MARRESQVSARTVWTVGLNGLGVLLLGWVAIQLKPVFTLVAIALLLAIAVEPLLGWFQRHDLSRGWAVGLTAVLTFFIGFIFVIIVIPLVRQQVRLLQDVIPSTLEKLRASPSVQSLAARLGVVGEFPSELKLEHGVTTVVGVIGIAGGILTEALAILALTVFGLLFGDELYQSFLRLIRPTRRRHADSLLRRMRDAIAGYVLGTLLMTLIGALFTAILLAAMGVPFFLPISLVMLVLGLIPFFGGILGAVLVALATLAAGGVKRALIALVLTVVYQNLAAHFLTPLVQRRTIKMNPLLMTAVLIAGAVLDGLVGAALALPFAAALQELLRDVQERRERLWRRKRRPPPEGAPAPRLPPTSGGSAPTH